MNLDAGYFYCLLRDGDPRPFTRVNVEWIDSEWEPVHKFVREFLGTHKKLPKVDTVRAQCGVEFYETEEEVGFYTELLCKRAARLSLEDGVLKELLPMIQHPADGDSFHPIEAAEKMMLLCSKIRGTYRMRPPQIMDYNKNIGVRVARYNKSKARQGQIGIPYPFEPMNLATGGMVGGEVTVALARSGVGKSWLYSLVCNHAVKSGYNVLAVSQEMQPPELSVRLDALGAGVSPERYWRGTLKPEEEEQMKRYLESLAERKNNIFLYGPAEVSSYEAFQALLTTMRPKIDLVAWDSPYLVVRGKKWEERADFCHEVKHCSEDFDVPFFVTWQLNRKGEPALTEAIMTDMDQCFIMSNENLKRLKQLLMFSLKTRQGLELEKLLLKWDTAAGEFDVLSWRIPGMGDSHQDYVVGGEYVVEGEHDNH